MALICLEANLWVLLLNLSIDMGYIMAMDTINITVSWMRFPFEDPMHYPCETNMVLADRRVHWLTDWLGRYQLWLPHLCVSLSVRYRNFSVVSSPHLPFSCSKSISFMCYFLISISFLFHEYCVSVWLWSVCGGFVIHFRYSYYTPVPPPSHRVLPFPFALFLLSIIFVQSIHSFHSFSSGLLTLLKLFRFIWNGHFFLALSVSPLLIVLVCVCIFIVASQIQSLFVYYIFSKWNWCFFLYFFFSVFFLLSFICRHFSSTLGNIIHPSDGCSGFFSLSSLLLKYISDWWYDKKKSQKQLLVTTIITLPVRTTCLRMATFLWKKSSVNSKWNWTIILFYFCVVYQI